MAVIAMHCYGMGCKDDVFVKEIGTIGCNLYLDIICKKYWLQWELSSLRDWFRERETLMEKFCIRHW